MEVVMHLLAMAPTLIQELLPALFPLLKMEAIHKLYWGCKVHITGTTTINQGVLMINGTHNRDRSSYCVPQVQLWAEQASFRVQFH
jgi:hypothetical protein